MAVFTLWAITVYLVQQRKNYVITLIPALFMTTVCATYLLSEQVLSLDSLYATCIAVVTCVVAYAWFLIWLRKYKKSQKQ